MYINNAVALTSTGKMLALATAPGYVSEILIVNTAAKPIYAKPYSLGEAQIAVTSTTGFKISTGASLTLSHTPTESLCGYAALGLVSTSTGACKVLAK